MAKITDIFCSLRRGAPVAVVTPLRRALVTLACLLTLGPGEAHAQECISMAVRSKLTSCQGITARSGVGSNAKLPTPAALKTTPKRTGDKQPKPLIPDDLDDGSIRDGRREHLKPKVLKLLLQEIATVERLYKSTPRNDADRPGLMRRLAEGYVELESSAFREKVTAESQAQQLRASNPALAAEHKRDATRATKVIKTARRSAIAYYKRLKSQYPKWCQFPHKPVGQRGCVDEVLYYLAYEYEQAGDLDKARAVYLELTENWKKSRFVPNAYLAFGELFFNEAQGDPTKWSYAANFYREVLKYQPPENKLYGYAAYKMAYVHWNQGDLDRAIDGFKATIEFGQRYPELPNASGLAASARRDIIPVYAQKGDAAQAFRFFSPLSGDRSSSGAAFKMMEDLGQNLLDTGHYSDAIVLYRDLIKRNGGQRSCLYQARISDAVMASKSGNKALIVAELGRQLAAYKDYQRSRQGAADKLACANESAALLTETAMAWHLEAVGSGGVRGTHDASTMKYSAALYQLVVGNFSKQQFSEFKFPRIVKEDWPTLASVRFAMANLLYHNKAWRDCGPAFDAVVAEDPNGPFAAEAAFAAALCYQEVYLAQHAGVAHANAATAAGSETAVGSARFAPRPLSSEQQAMLGAFDRYVCYVKQPDNDAEALEQYVEVKYARARTYYEAQHWQEAAWAFRDIAINHAQLDAAASAAQLYLASLDVLTDKLDQANPRCGSMMKQDVATFTRSFCGDDRKDSEEQCDALGRVERNLQWREAEGMVKACDAGTTTGCVKKYEQAGNVFYGMWKKYGEKACEAHAKDASDSSAAARCARSDEILYNAARAYQAARLIAKAIDVRRILISERYGLNNTEHAKLAVYEIGGNYQAIAVYDLASGWYERFARDYPDMDKAPDALSDAVVLRLGLGDSDKAIADAELFNRKYGQRKPAQAAQIAYAIGAHYAERDNWPSAERALSRAMRQIDGQATSDVRLQAHALLGRSYAKMKRGAQADREYGLVRDAWRDPAKMVQRITAIGGGEEVGVRRLGKVLTAVGEAYYHFADKQRAAADRVKFPAYRGNGDRADVDRFIKSKVKIWMDSKRAAINAADAEYLKIVALKPEPPPRWVIKSGAAVGNMWGHFVAEFQRAPYPKQWDSPGFVPGTEPPLLWAEVKAMYINRLIEASRSEQQAAKRAYDTCLRYSLQFQYFDEDSRSCEEWLSKTYPNDYHLIDEFRGAPTLVNSGLDERPQALEIGARPHLAIQPGPAQAGVKP